MRSLLVAHNVPWPSIGGGLLRLAQAVEAVASVSELDLFVLHDPDESKLVVPPTLDVSRQRGVRYPRTSPQLRWRLEWALRRGIPFEVMMPRADRGPRVTLREWARPPYDLVWFSTPATFEWTGRPDLGPTVVDLDNLEDVKAGLRAGLLADKDGSGDLLDAVRTRLAWYQARLNARDWRRFQHAVAAEVDRVAVASKQDTSRSALSNVTVIPNSYPRPRQAVGTPQVDKPPVVLFQGTLVYPPNIDAAQWLASTIAPAIRASVPETEVRLVGRPATSVTRLHQRGAVTVVGQVRSMEEELRRASVAVVPVRYGGGTRIKILESFAHRIPVVSTSVGAEGLDVEDGVHLLLADDPKEFAAATVRLLHDADLRVRMTEAAAVLYDDRYDGRTAHEGVRRLVKEVASASTRS